MDPYSDHAKLALLRTILPPIDAVVERSLDEIFFKLDSRSVISDCVDFRLLPELLVE